MRVGLVIVAVPGRIMLVGVRGAGWHGRLSRERRAMLLRI